MDSSNNLVYLYPNALAYQCSKNIIYNIWYRFRSCDPDSIRLFGLPAPFATKEENDSFIVAMQSDLPKEFEQINPQLTAMFRDFITMPNRAIVIADSNNTQTIWYDETGLRGDVAVPWKLPNFDWLKSGQYSQTVVTLVDKEWKYACVSV